MKAIINIDVTMRKGKKDLHDISVKVGTYSAYYEEGDSIETFAKGTEEDVLIYADRLADQLTQRYRMAGFIHSGNPAKKIVRITHCQ
ncbi:hypothetical protein [Metabacillus sp. Hm71]|uniref:hypothetical protein n=1 Tax=Metabacillus sp. Hm71 TaxID=3450743 RepID=UPI003F420D1E